MDKHTTDELLLRIKQKNEASQKAFNELADRYSALINSTVNRLCGSLDSSEREDMRQEAGIALYNAAVAYDLSQRQISFGLFAKICMNNTVISRLRKSGTYRTENLFSLEELKELGICIESGGYEASDPSTLIIDKESVRLLRGLIDENLSEYEKRVFNLYLHERSTRDIAAMLVKTEKSIGNAIYRIRVKLKKLLR